MISLPDRRQGPLGLAQALHPSKSRSSKANTLSARRVDGAVNARAMSGTVRALVQHGDRRFQGFQRKLTLVGVGYRAQAQGDKLNLSSVSPTRSCTRCPSASRSRPRPDRNRHQRCRQAGVGQGCCRSSRYRAPEPYKGKGCPLLRRSGGERNQEEVRADRSTRRKRRLRRSRKTRAKIAEMKAVRLSVFRSNLHIYAQSSAVVAPRCSAAPRLEAMCAQVATAATRPAEWYKLIAEKAKAGRHRGGRSTVRASVTRPR